MNIKINININSGTALLIYVIGFFALLWMTQHHEAVERVYPVALAGWTGAVSFFWVKRANNNKIQLESDKFKATITSNGPSQKGDPLT